MRTYEQLQQRLLLLKLRLKHKYSIVEHLKLDEILEEIKLLERISKRYWCDYE